eukprot:scaffold292528_cov15-Tisochrysis_lutea.AAC.1
MLIHAHFIRMPCSGHVKRPVFLLASGLLFSPAAPVTWYLLPSLSHHVMIAYCKTRKGNEMIGMIREGYSHQESLVAVII